MNKRRAITIKDIARKFNCSPSTVSRALNNHPSINVYTRKNIQEYAEKLGYQPNKASLSLLNKKTYTVGVIVPNITGYFNAAILDGIQTILEPQGYALNIFQTNEFYEAEVNFIHKLLANRVDGIFVSVASETKDYSHFEKVIQQEIPLIFFDRGCAVEANLVRVDHYSGAVMAVEHLIQMGCRRIAHLKGPEGLSVTQERLTAYYDVLKKHDLPIKEEYILAAGFRTIKGVYPTQKLLALPEPPDGIFAVNDNIAMAAMHVIREHGLRVPDDIAIVGFDDEPHAAYCFPTLSTIAQPTLELGKEAALLFLQQIQTEVEHFTVKEVVLPSQLIIRNSSLKNHPPTTS